MYSVIELSNSKWPRIIRLNFNEFLESGELDNYETTKHIVSECPYCVEHDKYRKKKLYIDKLEYNVGFCQHCKSVFINYTTELQFDVNSPKRSKQFKLAKLDNQGKYSYSSATKFESSMNDMLSMVSSRNIDKVGNVSSKIVSKRNRERYAKILELVDAKGVITGDGTGLIVFPFKINGEIIYWQSKLFGYSLKYFMPPISHKPLYIPKYVSSKIVLVEGIFDALACLYLYPDRTPVAVLGSYLTDYHIWLLRSYIVPTDCLIAMDNINISVNILHQIKSYVPTIMSFSLYFGKYDEDPDELLSSLNDNELEEFIKTHQYENKLEWQ